MPNIDHIMPNPHLIPILWGHDYVKNPIITNQIKKMLLDLVTGPFMNGLAQYGVGRGQVDEPIIIDDQNPPSTITYTDSNNQLKDEITKRLINWIDLGIVPSHPSNNDINQFYLIIPPSQTAPLFFNGQGDPIGNGVQAWHNKGKTDPPSPPTYYWAIIKTNDVGGPQNTKEFVNGITPKISHELVEQFVDRNDSFEEIGDPCNNTLVNYKGWQVQQYWSEWNKGCINGDASVSIKSFLEFIGFDIQHNGLRSLGLSIININNIAFIMQSH